MPSTEPAPSTTHTIEIRRRFERPPEGPDGWLVRPRRFFRFVILAARKARSDDLTKQSAALAFITLISLVPLLAAFSVLATRAFEGDQRVMVDLLGQILPYSEALIVENIEDFLEQARAVRGLGFFFFLISALAVFAFIERTLNQIWNIPRRRPLRTRLLSFTLLLFWGPVLIGATYSGLFFLRDQPSLAWLLQSRPAQIIPFLGTLLGLTMLYWLVPYTTVQFRSALFGGFLAAVLLEGLRRGLALYIEHVPALSLLYGSLGGVFLFFVSIEFFWAVILLGSELAYCTQHYGTLLHERHGGVPLEGSWLGFLALMAVGERFRRGEPITSREELAERLRLPSGELLDALEPLLRGGLLRETSGDPEGFLLARDPHEVPVSHVLTLYEKAHWELLEPFPEPLSAGLESLRARLVGAREESLDEVTLADLLVVGEEGEKGIHTD